MLFLLSTEGISYLVFLKNHAIMKSIFLFISILSLVSSNCQSLTLTFNHSYFYNQEIEIRSVGDSLIVTMIIIPESKKKSSRKTEVAVTSFDKFQELQGVIMNNRSALAVNPPMFDGIFMEVKYEEVSNALNFYLYTRGRIREEEQNEFATSLFKFLDELNWSKYSKRKIRKLKKLFQ